MSSTWLDPPTESFPPGIQWKGARLQMGCLSEPGWIVKWHRLGGDTSLSLWHNL
jgi:hypothetical protein